MWNLSLPSDRLGWHELIALFLIAFFLLGQLLPPIMRNIGRAFVQGPWR